MQLERIYITRTYVRDAADILEHTGQFFTTESFRSKCQQCHG
jgi:hypothetical protein